MSDSDIDWVWLVRHLRGLLSTEQEKQLSRRRGSDSSVDETVTRAEKIWEAAGERRDERETRLQEVSVDREWERLADRLRARENGTVTAENRGAEREREDGRVNAGADYGSGSRARRTGRSVLRIAALLVVALAGAVVVATFWESGDSTDTAERASPIERTFTTVAGEQSRIRLSDGSIVTLNAASTLRVRRPYGSGDRVVELAGEARFQVESVSRRPFIVRTDEAVVEVLGTTFGVRNYEDAEALEVVVTDGSVSVKSTVRDGSEEILASNEIGRIVEGGAIEVSPVNAEAYLSWSEGGLYFDNASLEDVAQELERRFVVEAVIRDSSIRNKRITSHLSRATLESAIRVVAKTLDIRHAVRGDSVIFMQPRVQDT